MTAASILQASNTKSYTSENWGHMVTAHMCEGIVPFVRSIECTTLSGREFYCQQCTNVFGTVAPGALDRSVAFQHYFNFIEISSAFTSMCKFVSNKW